MNQIINENIDKLTDEEKVNLLAKHRTDFEKARIRRDRKTMIENMVKIEQIKLGLNWEEACEITRPHVRGIEECEEVACLEAIMDKKDDKDIKKQKEHWLKVEKDFKKHYKEYFLKIDNHL